MFCGKCGAKVDDNATFCSKCGAPVGQGNGNVISKKPLNKKLLILCTVVIVVIIGVVVAVVRNSDGSGSFGKPAYEEPIKNYFEGIEKQDVELVKSAFHGAHLNYMPNNFSEDKMSRVYKKLQRQFGSDFKLSYKINSAEAVSDRDKNNIQDTFTGAENITEVNITLTVKGDETQEYVGDLIIASFDDKYDILKAGGYVYAWDEVLGAFEKA